MYGSSPVTLDNTDKSSSTLSDNFLTNSNITSAYKSFSQMHEAGILQENLELEESSIENIHPELHRISICCFTMLGSSLSCLTLQSVLQQR